MATISLTRDHGFAAAVLLGFWVQQSIVFVIPVAMNRSATGIQPPTLYPNDSEIKERKLTPEQVEKYNRAQRVHQNNVEFLTTYIPLYLVSAIVEPKQTAIAGALVLAGRMVTAIGYWSSAKSRIWGAWFHIPEFYTVYLVGLSSYRLITGGR